MKKNLLKCLFIFLFCISFSKAKAQWVSIPDTNFVNWLNTYYSSCMNGNLMDTTCLWIVRQDTLLISNLNITNLDGVQYFDSLLLLSCFNHNYTPLAKQIQNIPSFPPLLKSFNSSYNAFNSLPNLPDSLINFQAVNGKLQALPSLPNSLITLTCNDNNLSVLPNLPSSLITLSCTGNHLYVLPSLPQSLIKLYCSSNYLDSLPTLPPFLRELQCQSNHLDSLPALPPLLNRLECTSNNLISLPALPDSLRHLCCGWNNNMLHPVLNDSLEHFECYANEWTSLPALPDSLKYLNCVFNQISSFPNLPQGLTNLFLGYNPLLNFPTLPASLIILSCDSINLTSFPANFPPKLRELYCSYNPLTSLPDFPPLLSEITCNNTMLTQIPELNSNMYFVSLQNNPQLTCFPKFQTIRYFYWTNTPFTCLPNAGYIQNSTPAITGLPLCFSLSSCGFNWSMYGRIYNDTTVNCLIDSTEQLFKNMRVNLKSGGSITQSFIFNTEGYYSFKTGFGSYEIEIDTAGLPFDVLCPSSATYLTAISAADSTIEDLDFGLRCKPGFFDLVAKSISSYYPIRPGAQLKLYINAGDASLFYGVTCATGISGTVTATLGGPVNYVSPDSAALTPSSVSSNTITWNINDFSQVNPSKDFNINISVDTTATVFDTVCVQLTITPFADNNPANNSLSMCMPIVNSFDPNEKQVFPIGDIDTSQHWLTYTIYFQNTGNASANYIYILDTIDNDLDKNSFQFLSSSHEPIIQIQPNNIVRFNFPNINLPDSISDEPHSHGYVQYKIKLKNGLPPGRVIENTAHIYFDFNAPITTNTTQNTIVLPTSISYFNSSISNIQLYPNPVTNGILKINFHSQLNQPMLIALFDVTGRKVFSEKIILSQSTQNIALPDVSNGIYTCEVTSNSFKESKKVIVLKK